MFEDLLVFIACNVIATALGRHVSLMEEDVVFILVTEVVVAREVTFVGGRMAATGAIFVGASKAAAAFVAKAVFLMEAFVGGEGGRMNFVEPVWAGMV